MNINNQTEYKKPFGSRLLILFTVCMIVVAMAVPAFAAPVAFDPSSYPVESLPYPSSPGPEFDGLDVTSRPPLTEQQLEYPTVEFYATSNLVPYYVIFGIGPDTNLVAKNNGGGYLALYIQNPGYIYRLSSSGWSSTTSSVYDPASIVSSDVEILVQGTNDIFYSPPPPPDLGQEVTGVLPTVLSWIQQTLNALFVEGGALQGLLLLVAVPVAITLLFLAARFIRNLIWGA